MKCKNHVADLAAIRIIVNLPRNRGYPESASDLNRARRRADAKGLLDGVQSRGLQLSPDVRRWLLEATGY